MTSNIIRKGFVMSIFPEYHNEYKRRHDEIWPELTEVLSQHGARNYSIFLDQESSHLFAYVEISSQEKWDNIAETEICKKWWHYMKDIMKTNQDNSPESTELTSVFFME